MAIRAESEASETSSGQDLGNRSGQVSVAEKSVTAKLSGFYKADTGAIQYGDGGWIYDMFARGQVLRSIPKFFSWCVSGNVMSTLRWASSDSHATTIHDARLLEEQEGLSKSEFFHKFGFVLLDHTSRMSASDWLESGEAFLVDETAKPAEEQALFNMNADTPAKRIYAAECEALLREVVPGARDFFLPGLGARRGPDFYNLYATTVHADFPMEFELAAETNPWSDLKRQRESFLASDASEFWQVDLWRPVLPMKGPVKAHPLCFGDPRTFRSEDLVKARITGQISGGQMYLAPRYHPDQRYYYYPDMTTDEVLLFKNARFRRGEENNGDMPVFHSAFVHPETTKSAEPRLSFEYRVGFLV